MKAYGFTLKDVIGGEYRRWFNTNGILTIPMTNDLQKISLQVDDMTFGRACKKAKLLAEEYGFQFEELTEKDFRK